MKNNFVLQTYSIWNNWTELICKFCKLFYRNALFSFISGITWQFWLSLHLCRTITLWNDSRLGQSMNSFTTSSSIGQLSIWVIILQLLTAGYCKDCKEELKSMRRKETNLLFLCQFYPTVWLYTLFVLILMVLNLCGLTPWEAMKVQVMINVNLLSMNIKGTEPSVCILEG